MIALNELNGKLQGNRDDTIAPMRENAKDIDWYIVDQVNALVDEVVVDNVLFVRILPKRYYSAYYEKRTNTNIQ
tara:strand:+ start:36 stop:257 length:222 start_codon:yes stop_codon:yes gene_type:complete